MPLVNSRSLIQPFLPGSPGGTAHRGTGNCLGDGAAKRVPDENWKQAFPDCKHNKWLEDGDGATTTD